jgi:hypothetical protein
MKCFAMDDRMKSKDPFDIWYVVKRYPGGIDALIEAFRPHLGSGLVKLGLEILARKFERFDSWAPTQVGKFDSALNDEEQNARQRDSYERRRRKPEFKLGRYPPLGELACSSLG